MFQGAKCSKEQSVPGSKMCWGAKCFSKQSVPGIKMFLGAKYMSLQSVSRSKVFQGAKCASALRIIMLQMQCILHYIYFNGCARKKWLKFFDWYFRLPYFSLACFLTSSSDQMKMVFCYQNCFDLLWEKIILSSDQEKLLKFRAEGREFSKFFEITRTIYWNRILV